jgi:hypothetical protein
MNPQPTFLDSDPYLFISSIASTYPDVTLYDCQHLLSNRPSDGSTHMTGNGQDVSLRHLEIGHRVVGCEQISGKGNEFIAISYISTVCMVGLRLSRPLLILFRCTNCGARKFKLLLVV